MSLATAIIIIIRVVHLGAMALLTGAFAFAVLVARPALRGAGLGHREDARAYDAQLGRVAGISLAAGVLSALAWLGVHATVVSQRPLTEAISAETLWAILAATEFGQVWQLRLLLMALLAGFLTIQRYERDERDWLALRLEGLMIAGGATGALAWAGHAVASEGAARIPHLTTTVIHLLAAGAWLGGLLPLTLLLRRARAANDPSWVAAARVAVSRFSTLGVVAVALLVVTGLGNAWYLVGDIPSLIGTSYGRLLLLKLGLLLPLVGVAAHNRFRLKPSLHAGAEPEAVLARLVRTLLVEVALGASILVAVGALGTTPPGRHVAPTWPFTFRLSWEVVEPARLYNQLAFGAFLCALGLGVVAAAWTLRYRPRAGLALGVLAVTLGLWVSVSPLVIDAYPTTYLRPSIPYNAISVASGGRLYAEHCAGCHGPDGYGDGPAAASLSRRPADLTAKHASDHTAGDLFWWVTHGIPGTPMPGFGRRLSEEARWDLINYLRTLSAVEEARRLAPVAELEPGLVAPDFRFGIGVGRSEALKDHRGWAMVHLVLFTLPGSRSRLEALDRAWTRIGLAGARVLAVPMRDADTIYQRLGLTAQNFPILVEGSEEITETYTLFRRTLDGGNLARIPSHLEFLIDRQGYLRARWIPGEAPGWEDLGRLLREIERLDKEEPRGPAPDEHVH